MTRKTLSITISLFLIVSFGMAQQINYSAGPVKLIPETSFLSNADWKTLFYDESQSHVADRVGLNKQIAVGPDERVYISDRSNFTISILDKTGHLLKTFGKKGYKPGEFVNNQDFDGILNDKLLVISDNQGRINFFDLDGNFVKMITIDFMPLRIFPLKSGNLIIWGHVPVSGLKSKHVFAELDYNTEKYTVFNENVKSFEQPNRITIPMENNVIAIGAPYSTARKMIRVTDDDRVVFADNSSNIVKLFSDIDGKYKESEFRIKFDPIEIGAEEKEEYYQNFKEKLKKKGIDVSYAEKVKAEGFYPDHLPYFYNMILDEKNNCLFFIFTNNKDEDYAFQAYSIDGKFLGQSEFKIEGYDLLSKMRYFKFRDGFVYTLALKPDDEHPLRIIKCRMVTE